MPVISTRPVSGLDLPPSPPQRAERLRRVGGEEMEPSSIVVSPAGIYFKVAFDEFDRCSIVRRALEVSLSLSLSLPVSLSQSRYAERTPTRGVMFVDVAPSSRRPMMRRPRSIYIIVSYAYDKPRFTGISICCLSSPSSFADLAEMPSVMAGRNNKILRALGPADPTLRFILDIRHWSG